MFGKRILVPLDGSAESNAALPLARTIARQTGGMVTLLRVLRPIDRATDRDAFADAASTLERIADELGSADVPAFPSVCLDDDVAEAILEEIRGRSADLIIMRTRGHVGLERAVLGSVTERVLSEGGVPLILLRPGGRRVTRIDKLLVPVDGSPGGAVALGTAAALARATGASLHLLEVAALLPTFVFAGDAYSGLAYYDPAWEQEALGSADAYIVDLVTRLRKTGLTVDGEARQERDVAATIVSVADEAQVDVIVMSTEALTGAARALLGSVADAVVRTAHCPVLLVHRAEGVKMEATALPTREVAPVH